MRDKQRLILFTLTLLVWFLGIQFYMKVRYGKRPVPPSAPAKARKKETPGTEATQAPAPAGGEKAPASSPSLTSAEPRPESSPTPSYTPVRRESVTLDVGGKDDPGACILELDNRGAAVARLVLKNFFKNEKKKEGPLLLLSAAYARPPALALTGFTLRAGESLVTVPLEGPPLHERTWRISCREPTRVVFETPVAPGVVLTKEIRYDVHKGCFFVTFRQRNRRRERIQTSFEIVASPGLIPEYLNASRNPPKAVVAVRDESGAEELKTLYVSKVRKKPFIQEEGDFSWIAGCNKYFTVFLRYRRDMTTNCVPVLRGKVTAAEFTAPLPGSKAKEPYKTIAAAVQGFHVRTGPGEESLITFSFHALPLRKEDLQKTGIAYRQLIAPGNATGGLVDALAEFFLLVLRYIHAVFPNWGIAIIILTCLVNASLYPLNKKSQISMHKLQRLQPKIKEIQKKYKHNRAKRNEEMMKLYHAHGVNPAGGCLPIFIQLPIFIGLLFALRSSFDLRQSSFLWIKDLSLPDCLFPLPFGFVSSFNLLPILMSVAMYIQQKMTAPPPAKKKKKPEEYDAQEQMQSAMKFMPWFMLVVFYTLPSGLVLYWLTNSILRILETHHIKKHLPGIEQEERGRKRRKGGKTR